MAQAAFGGSNNYRIDVDATLVSQQGMTSTIYWRIIVHKQNTYGHRAWGNNGSNGFADASIGRIWTSGNIEYNFQNGSLDGSFLISEGTFNVSHDAAGNAKYFVSGTLNLAGIGSASASTGWRELPRIPTARVPDAPTPLGIDVLSATQMRYRFAGNGDGGAQIREWEVHWGSNPSYGQFSERGGVVNTGVVTVSVAPGTTYYFWSRGRNDIGWGPWSERKDSRSFSGMKILLDGVWRDALPYVNVNGVWRQAEPFVNVNGGWKKSI